MNLDTENLKQLINQAVDLSNEQKQEWVSLLEIMDEQQLLELEEILKLPVLPSMVDDGTENQEIRIKNQDNQKLTSPLSSPMQGEEGEQISNDKFQIPNGDKGQVGIQKTAQGSADMDITQVVNNEESTENFGQCVTGDTKLKRKNIDGNKKLSEWEDVEIINIKPGDEVLTLDEKTGELVTSKVKALMDMGVKQIWKLTTASGKSIRTTQNHPYLVKSGINGDSAAEMNADNVNTDEPEPLTFSFVDETGVGLVKDQKFFGVGSLFVRNPTSFVKELHDVFIQAVQHFKSSKDRLEFKFKNISETNLLFYEKLVNILEKHSKKWHFAALFEDKTKLDSSGRLWEKYIAFLSALLERNVQEQVVISDYMSKPKAAKLGIEAVTTGLPHVREILQLESQGALLLQLVDVLVGAINYDLKNNKQNKAKTAITAKVLAVLKKQKMQVTTEIFSPAQNKIPVTGLCPSPAYYYNTLTGNVCQDPFNTGAVSRLFPRRRGMATSQLHYQWYNKFVENLSSFIKEKFTYILDNKKNALRATFLSHSLEIDPQGKSLVGPQTLIDISSIQHGKNFVNSGVWKMVEVLKPGMQIAVTFGQKVVWERIYSITPQPQERVYDIEVLNTHNFVANNILAHNSAIIAKTKKVPSTFLGKEKKGEIKNDSSFSAQADTADLRELEIKNYASEKLQTLPKNSVGTKIKMPEILNSKKIEDVIKNKNLILPPQIKIIPARSGINGNTEKSQTEYSQQAPKIPKMPASIDQTQNSNKQTNIGKPIIAPPKPVKQNFVNKNNLPANLPFKDLAILPSKIPKSQETKLPQIPSAKNASYKEGNTREQPINLPQVPKKPEQKTERESKLDQIIKQKLEDLRTKL